MKPKQVKKPIVKVENKKYSRIYKSGNKHFRYNYSEGTLEWVEKYKFDKDYNLVKTEDWQFQDCQGLSRDNWENSPKYWCDVYNDELTQESNSLLKDFKKWG